jgi:membrane-bound lytic murein transglycosylase F
LRTREVKAARQAMRSATLAMAVLALSASVSGQTAVTGRYDHTFRKYSKRYFGPAFDWRLFKAQAIAESNLNVRARSRAGARGIMQLMPATYREIRSKNPEIAGHWDHPEWNIAAGIAYARQLWTAWLEDSHADHVREFMLGSYNAGRTTLLRAQSIARSHALDARVWPSIEIVAPAVPQWRYDETLGYLARVTENLAAMDDRGRIVDALR